MFAGHLDNFNNNIKAIKEFTELIEPVFNEKRKEILQRNQVVLQPLFSHLILHDQDPEWKNKDGFTHPNYSLEEIEIVKAYNFSIDMAGDAKDPMAGIRYTRVDKKFDEAYKEYSAIVNQKRRLYISSLINLISNVELFLSEILHYYYDQYPDASAIKKKSLTFEELKVLGSIEDAQKYLIDEKIEQILRGTFSDWVSVLKEELKLQLNYIDDYKDSLIEVFQRRNVLIHNGGKVNSIYLSKVNESNKQAVF